VRNEIDIAVDVAKRDIGRLTRGHRQKYTHVKTLINTYKDVTLWSRWSQMRATGIHNYNVLVPGEILSRRLVDSTR